MTSSTWAVLPVKRLDDAKSRLESVLSAKQRRDLARRLLEQSLEALRTCEAIDQVLVVSSDPEALELASQHGVQTLTETGTGLNPALDEARGHAVAGGATSLLVLACDLPLLDVSDIDSMIAAGHKAAIVIAPDRRNEGTNALLLRPAGAIEFNFGEASFQRHVTLAEASGYRHHVLKLSGLAFDIDLPEDWHDFNSGGTLLGDALFPGRTRI